MQMMGSVNANARNVSDFWQIKNNRNLTIFSYYSIQYSTVLYSVQVGWASLPVQYSKIATDLMRPIISLFFLTVFYTTI
jgi:hypothetical protein